MLDELEDVLIQADFGLDIAAAVTEALRRDRFDRDITPDEVRARAGRRNREGARPGRAAARHRRGATSRSSS